MFSNDPEVKVGIVTVSRACFPIELSRTRRDAVVASYTAKGSQLYCCSVIIENEADAVAANEELKKNGVNALVVFLGNFGPETPETLIAQLFDGPVMFAAAAEESKDTMFDGRGDAYCGMLNASYNLNLRGVTAYIPDYPVGTADEVADMIADFAVIAKIKIGLSGLKIIAFGPRPDDFLACNAPIKCLYDLGVAIQENSELDLFVAFNEHENDPRIPALAKEMEEELTKEGNNYPGVLPRLAQYELTLLDWAENNLGASKHVIFANKCWPAFQTAFKLVPCYVNGRLAARGIPVSCETDIYGALSEYILYLATGMAPTLLDINNSVPRNLYEENKAVTGDYKLTDMFMGFHCGNTSTCLLKKPSMKYQLIMKRSLEPDSEPDITRGTCEGELIKSPVTLFRLQSTADSHLRAYIAHGETLDMPTHSFGSIGVIAVPEMGRFYRHVLIEKNYPHHSGVGFKHCGKYLYEVMKLLGVSDVEFNRPKGSLYKSENPFE